ncbi:MAG: diheme cytochrome c [Deltaproteobacteria bacterium]|nr:diheme cytochrome c [Deltaproteobacteria bacterium]
MKMKKFVLPLLSAGLLLTGMATSSTVFADGRERGERNERNERGEREERGDRNGGRTVPPADNPAYKQECSSCHFLYQPGLLPARSWGELMMTADKHFGESLGLDEKTVKDLTAYLTANGADKQTNMRSRRIADSISPGSAPTRITEAPYIVKEHRKISKETFSRPSIKSFSNCGACHTKGAEGNFEEDFVEIPKK